MKDREMEVMEENHRVEVRGYIQKVKHLAYEHKNQVKKMTTEGEAKLGDALDTHNKRESELRKHKQSLKLELLEAELNDEERVVHPQIAQRGPGHPRRINVLQAAVEPRQGEEDRDHGEDVDELREAPRRREGKLLADLVHEVVDGGEDLHSRIATWRGCGGTRCGGFKARAQRPTVRSEKTSWSM